MGVSTTYMARVLLLLTVVIVSVVQVESNNSEEQFDEKYPSLGSVMDSDDSPRFEDNYIESSDLDEESAGEFEDEAMSLAEARRQVAMLRERDRHLRIQNLKIGILRNLGMKNVPSINPIDKEIILNKLQSSNPEIFSNFKPRKDRRCLVSNCSSPGGTHEHMWQSPDRSHLRLNFPISKRRRSPEFHMSLAHLRVYLKPLTNCPCFLQTSDDLSPKYIISVHQFLRPLSIRKANRVVYKRRLLDEVEVVGYGNVWVSLDVKRAVAVWLSRARKNFGLEVSVRDVNGTVLNAQDILVTPDCSERAERICPHHSVLPVEEIPWTRSTLLESNYRKNTPHLDLNYFY